MQRPRGRSAPSCASRCSTNGSRHPLYLGFFLAFWATPEMTAGHLLLAAGVSVYMLIAIRYEERDLTGLFGDDYRRLPVERRHADPAVQTASSEPPPEAPPTRS